MRVVGGFLLGVLIRGDMWVEDADIAVSPLQSSTPVSTCHDVKSCALVGVGSSLLEGFTIQWWKVGFSGYIVTDLG